MKKGTREPCTPALPGERPSAVEGEGGPNLVVRLLCVPSGLGALHSSPLGGEPGPERGPRLTSLLTWLLFLQPQGPPSPPSCWHPLLSSLFDSGSSMRAGLQSVCSLLNTPL